MTLLKWWFGVSAAILFLLFTYAFVPVLLPVLAIAGGLALITAIIVGGAQWLERKLGRTQDGRHPEDPV